MRFAAVGWLAGIVLLGGVSGFAQGPTAPPAGGDEADESSAERRDERHHHGRRRWQREPGDGDEGRHWPHFGPGRDRPGRDTQPVELTDEQKAELIDALREYKPHLLERLEALRERRPDSYDRALSRMWGWYQRWKDLPADIRESTLTVQREMVRIWRLTREYRRSEDEERREALYEQMKQAGGRLFDADRKVRRYRLAQLRKRLEELEAELDARAEKREQIIQQRLDDWLAGRFDPPRPGGDRDQPPPEDRPGEPGEQDPPPEQETPTHR